MNKVEFICERSVIRRAHTNVIKLCILVKSLNISVDLLMNTDLAIADNITDNFVQQCSILLLSLDSGCFLIDSLTWKSAIKLHSFLMIQKLILLGFPIRQNDYDFLDTLESFFNSHIE